MNLRTPITQIQQLSRSCYVYFLIPLFNFSLTCNLYTVKCIDIKCTGMSFLFILNFYYFEIILYLQKVTKIIQRIPIYSLM